MCFDEYEGVRHLTVVGMFGRKVVLNLVCLGVFLLFFFLMIRRPPGSTQGRSSAASGVYKGQAVHARVIGILVTC